MNQHMTDSFLSQDEERKELRAKIDEVNKIAFNRWTDPSWRNEMAADMTEVIYRGFEHENLLNYLTTVENAPMDGRVFIKEVRGLRAFWLARGGYIEASSMTEDVIELPRDLIGFHVTEFEDKIMTNFAETQANLVDLGIQRMDAEVNLRFLRLLQAAIPSSSPYYTSASGLSLTTLNKALRDVRDESRDFQVAIVGRSTMTEQIMDLLTGQPGNSAFLPSTNEDVVRRGLLGTYRGAPVIALKNYKDDQEKPFFPANELYVIARDASRMAFWGGLRSKEWVEDEVDYWHYRAWREFGGIVHRPQRLRRIVDSSIAAYTSYPND